MNKYVLKSVMLICLLSSSITLSAQKKKEKKGFGITLGANYGRSAQYFRNTFYTPLALTYMNEKSTINRVELGICGFDFFKYLGWTARVSKNWKYRTSFFFRTTYSPGFFAYAANPNDFVGHGLLIKKRILINEIGLSWKPYKFNKNGLYLDLGSGVSTIFKNNQSIYHTNNGAITKFHISLGVTYQIIF